MLAAIPQYRLVGGQTLDPTYGTGDLWALGPVIDVPGSRRSASVAIGIGGESANAFGCVVERNVQRAVEAAQELLEQRFLLFSFRNQRRTGHLYRRGHLWLRGDLRRRGHDRGR